MIRDELSIKVPFDPGVLIRSASQRSSAERVEGLS